MGFKRSKKKIHKNRFNRRKRLSDLKGRIVFYLKIILIITIVPAVSCAFIFIYDCITQSDCFRAKNIEIKGNKILSNETILKESGIKLGDNIFAINISKARKNIMSNPWAAEVEVNRKIPSAIAITIKEYKCLAVIDIGKKYLINEQGEIYKEKDSSDIATVPVIQGLCFSDFDMSEKRKTTAFDAVMTVLKLGQKPECILPNTKIKLIQVDKEIGLTIVAFDENRIINLGYGKYKGKYERLNNVLNYVNNESEFHNFECIYIDNDLNRVIVRPLNELLPDKSDSSVDEHVKSPLKLKL